MALTRVDPADFATRRDAIAALDAAARVISGHDALGEAIWLDLEAPGPDSVGFLIDGRAYIHVLRLGSHWAAGTIRIPEARDRATTTTLLEAAAAHVGTHGGGHLECWVFGATGGDDAVFSAAGLHAARDLFEMRVPLPRAEEPKWPSGVSVRAFEAVRDDAAWLRVNNHAFADHPDQGGWTEATLRQRMAEPWFDPTLFLLAIDSHGIAGFDWCKVHAPRDPDPALGEIYVIGVDPRAQGTGLGRALVIAGLAALHSRGVTTGTLFCASDNVGALALYRSIGFEVHRTDRAYARDVAAR